MILSRYLKFSIGLFGILVTLVALPKIYNYIPGSANMRHVIEMERIDAAALFYSSESRSAGSRKEIEEKLVSIK